MSDPQTHPVQTTPCPACDGAARSDQPHYPFCSLRCKQADLYEWLSGSYQPPGFVDDDDDERGGTGDMVFGD